MVSAQPFEQSEAVPEPDRELGEPGLGRAIEGPAAEQRAGRKVRILTPRDLQLRARCDLEALTNPGERALDGLPFQLEIAELVDSLPNDETKRRPASI